MTIDELINCVGMPYKQLDENGKALGCMLPVYLLYPEIPKYDWPPDDSFAEYFTEKLKKHGKTVNVNNIKKGDIVSFKMPFGFLHVGVYCKDDNIIHCAKDDSLELMKLSTISRRIEGVFRWK